MTISPAKPMKQTLRLREVTPFSRYSKADLIILLGLAEKDGFKTLAAKLRDDLKMRS